MALGYEGVIRLGSTYALGTGASVPRARVRMESSSGYGGTIKDLGTTGIGLPHNYDWEQHDGSLNFDVTSALITSELKPWLLNRQLAKTVEFKSRKDNDQLYTGNCYWNNISFDAGEGSAVTGSVGFVSLARSNYTWGAAYKNNKTGMGLLPCSGGSFPEPLNSGLSPNVIPVPFWNSRIVVTPHLGVAAPVHFLTWSLNFSQDVVKFFGCTGSGLANETTPIEPQYLAVGPMTVTFTGTYMQASEGFSGLSGYSGGYLGDNLDTLEVTIGGVPIRLNRLEATTEQDDVQTGDSFVPLSVEYVAYEIAA